MADKKLKLDYETPKPPEKDSSGCAPYVIFAGFAVMVVFGLLLQDGSTADRKFGLIVCVVAGLGAVTLPIVIAIQKR